MVPGIESVSTTELRLLRLIFEPVNLYVNTSPASAPPLLLASVTVFVSLRTGGSFILTTKVNMPQKN